MKKSILFLVCSIMLISLISAGSFGLDLMPLDGSDHVQPLTTFDYRFIFSNVSDCSSGILMDINKTIMTDIRGHYLFEFGDLNFTVSDNYLCEYKNYNLRTIHQPRDMTFDTLIANDSYFNSVNVSNNLSAEYILGKLDYNYLYNEPTDLSDFNIDLDLSDFLDDLGNRGYSHLTNFTNNLNIGNWTLDKPNYYNKTNIDSFSYYNLSNFNINDYYLNSNPNAYYNSTTIPTYVTTESDPVWISEKGG